MSLVAGLLGSAGAFVADLGILYFPYHDQNLGIEQALLLEKERNQNILMVVLTYTVGDSRTFEARGASMDLRSFFATFVAGVFVAICAFYIATRGPLAATQGWTAEGLVTVILTATTVVLAALGIAVALIAIWGYDRIKTAAITSATAAAEKIADATASRVATDRAEAVAARQVQAWIASKEAEGAEGDISTAFPRNGESS